MMRAKEGTKIYIKAERKTKKLSDLLIGKVLHILQLNAYRLAHPKQQKQKESHIVKTGSAINIK